MDPFVVVDIMHRQMNLIHALYNVAYPVPTEGQVVMGNPPAFCQEDARAEITAIQVKIDTLLPQ